MGKWIAQKVAHEYGYVGSDAELYDSLILAEHGGGRSKPVWAERIAKKYAWTALSQLASRLHDHIEAHREPWEERVLETPLIFPEGRKLDPTIPDLTPRGTSEELGWELPRPEDLAADGHQDFESWVNDKTIPRLRSLLQPVVSDRQRLRPILAYLSWHGAERRADSRRPYREVWANLQTYIVPRESRKRVYECLRGQNLLGLLPRAMHFLRGFAAEYPWATVFATNDDAEELRVGVLRDLPFGLIPAWSEVVCEWEYDTSRSDTTLHVPNRRLFVRGLRWDGHGGFVDASNKTIFMDPSFHGSGPAALLADMPSLDQRLAAEGVALVYTLVGEKRILTPGFGRRPVLRRSTFSQVGYADGDTEHASRPYFVAD